VLREILAFDQLHDERDGAARLFQAVNLRDVRMVERGEHFGFPLKTGQPFRIAGDVAGEDLERDLALQL
jgi:hypothetical protein